MMEVFPVSVVPYEGPPLLVRRGGQTKRCSNTRLWFVDWHMARRRQHFHHAQDIFAPQGSIVMAPNAGRIREVRNSPKGGHALFLEVLDRRGRVVRTYYMSHLRDVPLVRAGEMVQAGQPLGYVGRTGNAGNTCPHLHIGCRRYQRGQAINIYRELQRLNPTGPRGADVLPRVPPKPPQPTVERTTDEAQAECAPETSPATTPAPEVPVETLGKEVSPELREALGVDA